jgi:hypothetical protein
LNRIIAIFEWRKIYNVVLVLRDDECVGKNMEFDERREFVWNVILE